MITARKITQPRIVQPDSERWGWRIMLFLFPVTVLISSWYAYEYGRTGILFNSMMADSTVTLLERQVETLQRQVENLGSEREKLQEEVAVLERTSQIDREAARILGEEMKSAQEARLKMEEELVFLRSIVSNKSGKKGLHIRDFRLQSSEKLRVFKYSFTVSQVLNYKEKIKGDLFITVAGKQDGKAASLTLVDLMEEGGKSLKVDFKHFQKFEGLLQLPEKFVANKMTIDVKPSKKKLPRLSETFKWSAGE